MHQTRQETTTRIPIRRKGTKYVARALQNPGNAVPVVVALRDMLHLTRTSREANELRKDKVLKINGRVVLDNREAIQIFSILTVGDKNYRLSLLPTNKFFFEETKEAEKRACKVIGKRLVNSGKIQLSLHDGSSVIGKADMNVGDTLYLNSEQKIVKHVPLDAGVQVFVIQGRYVGKSGKIIEVKGKTLSIKIEDKEVTLPSDGVIAQ